MTDTTHHRRSFSLGPLLTSILITLVIGFTGSFFTRSQIPGWYATLAKPSFNPPAWLFGPVWTTLYIMIGIAAYLVWQHRDASVQYTRAKVVYFVQLGLNFLWSPVFFGMHQLLPAFVVIVLLWLSIILNIVFFARFSKAAALLLIPYLLWVSFASVLNISIYLLNQ